MWLKIKLGIFCIVFLSSLILLTGCVEEPTIAPARRTYSVMRVVNLSNSSAQIYIDDNQPDGSLINVILPSTTAYFDICSGARRFVVLDTNLDTIFNNNIELISYEREIISFTGSYNDVSENNTFTNMKVPEGEIYFNVMPDAGQLGVVITNAFPGYYNEGTAVDPANLTVRAVYWSDPDSAELVDTLTFVSNDDGPLQFGDNTTIGNIDPGSYEFLFLTRNVADDADSLVVAADSAYYSADMRYYLFVYGNLDVFSVYKNEVASLPVRSIYE
ncbi:MAG: hypothetical protein KAQ90_12175 [Melioribacteraceae bacterium]|nr:hypothetical protein [Melioribacteraceae bacterium]